MLIVNGLIIYAIVSGVVVAIEWLRVDYYPSVGKIIAATVFWPGWVAEMAWKRLQRRVDRENLF